jgi:hypothetical protein
MIEAFVGEEDSFLREFDHVMLVFLFDCITYFI